MTITDIHLGELVKCNDYQGPGDFWIGFLRVPFYLNCDGNPKESHTRFVKSIVVDSEIYIDKARTFLQHDIVENYGKYNISNQTMHLIRGMSSSELPFDLPEFTFYPRKEWQIRFAAGNLLSAFNDLGVAVSFIDQIPIEAECLSS